ncbi:MAG: hypothetical protein U0228_07230 [Myxococcaceae bacterium]
MPTRLPYASTVALFAALAFASFTGCQEDMTAEKARWDGMQKEWATKLEATKKGHAELAEKLKAVAAPEGEGELVAARNALNEQLTAGEKAITEAEKAVGEAKANIEGLIAKGKKVPVEVALGNVKNSVDGHVMRASSLVNAGNEQLEQLDRKMQTLKAEGEAAKSRTSAWAGEVKKKGGMLAIDDIVFQGEGLVADKSRVALTSLVATLKTCAEVRVEVAVTAVSDVADLGSKRAEALKGYLTGKGVDAAVLAKVSGTSAKEGDEKVAVNITTPCK